MAGVLTSDSDDPSSNTIEVKMFHKNIFEKTENKQKEAGVCIRLLT